MSNLELTLEWPIDGQLEKNVSLRTFVNLTLTQDYHTGLEQKEALKEDIESIRLLDLNALLLLH